MLGVEAYLDEALLQLAWRYLLFDRTELQTDDGRPLEIVSPGRQNLNAGPDFHDAQLVLDGLTTVCAVELHVNGDDWFRHNHQLDPNYNNVGLHVVAFPGRPAVCQDGITPAQLTLGPRLRRDLLGAYAHLRRDKSLPLPCAPFFAKTPALHKRQWFDRLAIGRLMDKSEALAEMHDAGEGDWRQTLMTAIAGALAGPLNKEAFLTLAQRLPARVVGLYADQPVCIEALVFGASGLLDEAPPDEFVKELRFHWERLAAKHSLKAMNPAAFQFHRMRPGNFPTIRLAQWAALYLRFDRWRHTIRNPEHFAEALAACPPSDYWTSRYRFGPAGRIQAKLIGASTATLISINAVAPYLALLASRGGDATMEDAAAVLQALPAEDNAITRKFEALGDKPAHALDTQAYLALYAGYCEPRRCIECAIGREALKKAAQ